MSNLFDIKDKAAVITGGGGVLCGTMAAALAEAGAKVAVLDLVEAAAAKVVDKIKARINRDSHLLKGSIFSFFDSFTFPRSAHGQRPDPATKPPLKPAQKAVTT